jgi:hypothetical protein
MVNRLGKTLGKGTFGKVKLGTHIITKEKVIIIIESHLFPHLGCNKNIGQVNDQGLIGLGTCQ